MSVSRSYHRRGIGGRIHKVVREHILRDDIDCGIVQCAVCKRHNATRLVDISTNTLVIVDTNVILHQLDVITHSAFEREYAFVIPQTAMDEAAHRSAKLSDSVMKWIKSSSDDDDDGPYAHRITFSNEYCRQTYVTRQINETSNDRNDRAIRQTAIFYQTHMPNLTAGMTVPERGRLILLSDDRENRLKSAAAGITAMSVAEFIHPHVAANPILSDLLYDTATADGDDDGHRVSYDEHLSDDAVRNGLTDGSLKRGTFRVNGDFWAEGTVTVRGQSQPILIPNFRSMNRAFDGDQVAVRILPREKWCAPHRRMEPTMEEASAVDLANVSAVDDHEAPSPDAVMTGRVVAITQRNWRSYCGSLDPSTSATSLYALFIPVNRRIPRIRIQTRQLSALMQQRIVVAVDGWSASSGYAHGHYVRTMGSIGDRDTETQVLLFEHDIPTAPWSIAVLSCLPAESHTINPDHVVGRLDFRSVDVFSIDPPGCTDIDDALSCRRLDNGHFEVGVHIADVSHYIEPNSALDLEAAHRGTSVYLVDRRIDMIPPLLSTNLCSLKPNVDRLTFSVIWTLDEDANIVDTKFHRAVINSRYGFTYAAAQDRIDSSATDPITQACKTLNGLAKRLKKRRIEAGALQLASAEVKFLIDQESQEPMDVELYQLRETNSLVEEFMLLANISVAQRILEAFPSASLLRRHEKPKKENFLPLINAARTAGFEIKCDTSADLARSLDACVIAGQPNFNHLMRMIATRCMTQAAYFCTGDLPPSEYWHYGLATPVYTHFTSPIRRYADVVVHRQLVAALHMTTLPMSLQDKENVRQVADVINHRHRMARMVSRASTALYILLFFTEKFKRTSDNDDTRMIAAATTVTEMSRPVNEDAMIVLIRSKSIKVFVTRYGIEGVINIKATTSHDNQSRTLDERNGSEKDSAVESITIGPRTFRLFEKIRVRIVVLEKNRRRWLSMDIAEQETATTPTTSPNKRKVIDHAVDDDDVGVSKSARV